jgi:hypothetical protein
VKLASDVAVCPVGPAARDLRGASSRSPTRFSSQLDTVLDMSSNGGQYQAVLLAQSTLISSNSSGNDRGCYHFWVRSMQPNQHIFPFVDLTLIGSCRCSNLSSLYTPDLSCSTCHSTIYHPWSCTSTGHTVSANLVAALC